MISLVYGKVSDVIPFSSKKKNMENSFQNASKIKKIAMISLGSLAVLGCVGGGVLLTLGTFGMAPAIVAIALGVFSGLGALGVRLSNPTNVQVYRRDGNKENLFSHCEARGALQQRAIQVGDEQLTVEVHPQCAIDCFRSSDHFFINNESIKELQEQETLPVPEGNDRSAAENELLSLIATKLPQTFSSEEKKCLLSRVTQLMNQRPVLELEKLLGAEVDSKTGKCSSRINSDFLWKVNLSTDPYQDKVEINLSFGGVSSEFMKQDGKGFDRFEKPFGFLGSIQIVMGKDAKDDRLILEKKVFDIPDPTGSNPKKEIGGELDQDFVMGDELHKWAQEDFLDRRRSRAQGSQSGCFTQLYGCPSDQSQKGYCKELHDRLGENRKCLTSIISQLIAGYQGVSQQFLLLEYKKAYLETALAGDQSEFSSHLQVPDDPDADVKLVLTRKMCTECGSELFNGIALNKPRVSELKTIYTITKSGKVSREDEYKMPYCIP